MRIIVIYSGIFYWLQILRNKKKYVQTKRQTISVRRLSIVCTYRNCTARETSNIICFRINKFRYVRTDIVRFSTLKEHGANRSI